MVDSKSGQAKPLIISIVGPLMNKVKMSMLSAKKNQNLAEKLSGTIYVLAEQLLPHYLAENISNYENVNTMHNLCYLLAMKTQQVFNSRIIHTCIDQNWDLKGFKQVLVRILKQLDCKDYDDVTSLLDFTIKTQNLQSSSCIKAIGSFIRNSKKPINEDDLGNPVDTYETQFEFLKADIQQYRNQRIKHECFSVLHPWAYDLDKVDFKYIMNNDLTQKVCNELRTQNAQVFWLTFFKSQAAISADDFFGALRELANLNKIPQFYEMNLPEYQRAAIASDFVFSLSDHAENITVLVQQVVDAGSRVGFNALQDQVKAYTTEFDISTNKITTLPSGMTLSENPRLHNFMNDRDLGAIRMRELSPSELEIPCNLQRTTFEALPDRAASHKLHMKFEAVDTEELKNLEISVDGTRGIFKVGEGEANHYQIPNDKKLWESQLMIVCKDGKYYIRDLGIVHTSRIKVDMNTSIQIQQDALIDLGKVVHYHFDKVTYMQNPTQEPTPSFFIMRPNSNDYVIEEVNDGEQDPPTLRARPTWVSSDENKDLIQKEIILEALEQQPYFSIGRSMKREVQIKLKAVSADHCNITYEGSKGWFISESGKDKASSNGTFVFMKSQKQMQDHEPSSLIPLHDGMVISFINYEIRVNLERKDAEKVAEEDLEIRQRSDALQQTANLAGTMPSSVAAQVEEEKVETPAEIEVAVAEPEQNAEPAEEEEHHVVVAEAEQSIHGGDSDNEKVEEPKADSPKAASAKADSPVKAAESDKEEAKAEEPAAAVEEAKADSPAKASEAEAVAEVAAAASDKEEAKVEAAASAKADSPRADSPKAASAKADSPAKAAESDKEEAKAEEPAAAVEEAKADSPAKASEAEAVAEVAAAASDKEEAKVEAAASAKADSPRAASPAKAESPKASPAKADSPKAASAKADSPAKAAESDKEEAKSEAPVAAVEEQAAVVEEAKVEAAASAKADSPRAASPAKADSPKASPAKADSPKAASAKADSPAKAAESDKEEAKAEAPAAEATPVVEEAKVAEAAPAQEEAKAEAPAAVVEEAKADSPKASPAKADSPKASPAKADSPKAAAAPAQPEAAAPAQPEAAAPAQPEAAAPAQPEAAAPAQPEAAATDAAPATQ